MFSLPKNEYLRKKWLRTIPNNLDGLKHPVVCIVHFAEKNIIRSDKCIVKGKLQIYINVKDSVL